MTKALAIDTCTELCSVALSVDGKIYESNIIANNKHGNMVLPMIDQLLAEAKITLQDLDYIAFDQGPGSFTGVRIGCACAKSLALGLDKKLLGACSLEVLAQGVLDSAKENDLIISAIDARMQEVYLAIYKKHEQKLELLEDYAVLPYNHAIEKIAKYQADNILTAGNGIKILKDNGLNINDKFFFDFPNAKYILSITHVLFNKNEFLDIDTCQPIYIRNDVTWKKVEQQR